jgi:3-hydroxyacyl-[acyl-carrier-protein] dehydratase
MMDIREIRNTLPHNYPFLLVDRIIEIELGKRIIGIKNAPYTEPFFPGHFPGRPIMPGVLIVEAMAQTAGVLAFKSVPKEDCGKPVYFLGLYNVRFRKPVVPGDQLRLELEVTRHRQSIWGFKGKAFVEDKLVAEADLLAMLGEEK